MKESKFLSAMIIGLSFIVGAAIFGGLYYEAQRAAKNDGTLSVIGSTKSRVTSDQAKIIIALSRTVLSGELAAGYKGMAADLASTEGLLKKDGVAQADINESPVSMTQVYDPNNTGVIRYQLNQTVTLQSSDVNKITDLSKKVPELASAGVIVSVQALEYYYSKLPEMRVSLLAKAVEDSKARAEQIAQGTGRHVGEVQNASAGVVQVLAPNSVDVSDYGSYDTSSIEKDVMVAVQASFRLK